MKREIPIAITFILSILMIITYFIDSSAVDEFQTKLFDWVMIISTFALLLGIFNLLLVHFSKLKRGGLQSFYSLTLIVSFFIVLISGLYNSDDPNGVFTWFFKYILRPLQSTMFSLLAFYVASASFRAFRAKTKEATILLISAFLVMLGRVPIGTMIWKKIPVISNWIMLYPTAAAQSAIMIGAALGAVSMAIKIILGIERTYLGGDE